jgi:paraquat-inducible protein B
VTFRGVRVGAVEGILIQFDPTAQVATIPVTVQLEPSRVRVTTEGGAPAVELPELITRGLRAELNTQSFVTGQSEIDLDFDPASPAVLHPGSTDLPKIPTRQSAIQRVKEQLSQLPLRELVADASATLQSLRALSGRLDGTLPPLIESLRATSDHTTQGADAAAGAIQHLQVRLDATLGEVGKVAATGDRQLNQRGAELHTLLAASTQAIQQARDVLGGVQGLTSDRTAAHVNLEAALRDLAAATASLRGLASAVERNPQLLLTGRRP